MKTSDMDRNENVSEMPAAVITGAARGIGLAISERLVLSGYPVIMLDLTESVFGAAQSLSGFGVPIRAVQMDISNSGDVNSLPGRVGSLWSSVGVLVNNAGISPKHNGRKKNVDDMSVDEWMKVIDINLTGTFRMMQQCLPVMKKNRWGRIISITSQAARTRTVVPGAHYSASKAGITGLSRVLAGEVADWGITVNCVAPGRIESEMTSAVGQGVNSKVISSVPIGRLGLPTEVASAVSYLASRESSYITGATIDVNGGAFML